jgi:hypothetical protein
MNAREANYFAGTRARGRASRSTDSIYSNTPIIPTDDLCQPERSGAGASVLDEFDPGGRRYAKRMEYPQLECLRRSLELFVDASDSDSLPRSEA